MAKIVSRKARKDYPAHGITKGDQYFFCQIKTGPRSSRILRSLTPFKPSQLTTSPFKSGFYSAQEGWESSGKGPEDMRAAAEAIRELGTEAQEGFDNMPEGLQQGDTGQMLENRASECERIADELEGYADEYEGLDEPDEPDPVPDHDGDNEEAIGEAEGEHDDYQTALAELDEARQALSDSAEDCVNDMPE